MTTAAHQAATRPEAAHAAQLGRALLPARVRHVLYALVGVLLLGAVWLVSVRGSAILLDLSGMASLFCL